MASLKSLPVFPNRAGALCPIGALLDPTDSALVELLPPQQAGMLTTKYLFSFSSEIVFPN